MNDGTSSYHEEDRIGSVYDTEILGRLLSYLRPYLYMFFGSVFLAAVITGAELGRPYLLKVVIDQYITPAVQTETLATEQALIGIWNIGLYYFGLLLVQFLGMYLQNILLYDVGQNIMYDLRKEVFEQLLRLPLSTHDTNPTGRLVTRATNDVEAINRMYSQVLVSLLKDVLMVIGLLVVMLVTDWKLTLIVLLLAPVAYTMAKLFRDYVREAYRRMRKKVAELNSYVDEHLSGMHIIKSFAQEERSAREFEEINEEEFDSRMDQLKIYGVFRPLVHLMRIIATALVLWVGGFQVIHSAVTIGSLVLFLSYVEKLFKPLRELAQKYDVLQRAMASAERIFDILDRDTESYEGSAVPAKSEGRKGRRIEFERVWFRYGSPDDEDPWVLRDVSFTVKPGEKVGFVGPTGAGKTTVFKLLLRWYDAQRGQILLDGTNIRSLDLRELRSQFGVVLQDGFLFSGNVMKNMKTMGVHPPDATVRDTARRLGVDSYVESLPEGYRTKVSSGGQQMSQGERQYISLTRALVSDPDILLFDEATADMDTGLQNKLLEGLTNFGFDRTSLTIAHRLSTIRHCDRIFVLDRGEIVERGDHRSLLANDGLYASLYDLQVQQVE